MTVAYARTARALFFRGLTTMFHKKAMFCALAFLCAAMGGLGPVLASEEIESGSAKPAHGSGESASHRPNFNRADPVAGTMLRTKSAGAIDLRKLHYKP